MHHLRIEPRGGACGHDQLMMVRVGRYPLFTGGLGKPDSRPPGKPMVPGHNEVLWIVEQELLVEPPVMDRRSAKHRKHGYVCPFGQQPTQILLDIGACERDCQARMRLLESSNSWDEQSSKRTLEGRDDAYLTDGAASMRGQVSAAALPLLGNHIAVFQQNMRGGSEPDPTSLMMQQLHTKITSKLA